LPIEATTLHDSVAQRLGMGCMRSAALLCYQLEDPRPTHRRRGDLLPKAGVGDFVTAEPYLLVPASRP